MSKTAIIHGKIQTMAGAEYQDGTILMEDGKIAAIGENLPVPEGYEVIDAGGRLVLPGFVDAHSHLGMWEDCSGSEGSDGNEATDPVTPQIRAIDSVYPYDIQFAEARAAGITAVATGPGSANVIGGTFFAMKTYGNCVDEMVVRDPIAMKCAFGENPKRFYGSHDKLPSTRMGVASVMRDTLNGTLDYLARKNAAGDDPLKRPTYNSKYEALIPVVEGRLPIKVHAHRSDDILTAVRIAKEFNLKMTLDHCTEGHLIVKQLVAAGYPAIVGPSFGPRPKPELANKTFKTAAILAHAGIKVAIMTDYPVNNEAELPIFASLAQKCGMTRDEALRAITINAAEIIGVDDRIGSLEVGKDADVVVWDVDPLDINYKTYCTVIDGSVVHKMDDAE